MNVLRYLFNNLITALFDRNWRLSKEWGKTKKLAKIKYGNKCDKCGSKKDIEVHHLESAKDNKLLRFELGNLVLLCKSCHRTGNNAFHRWMGGTRVKCTTGDYKKWKKIKKN